jgi:hypothetical protein
VEALPAPLKVTVVPAPLVEGLIVPEIVNPWDWMMVTEAPVVDVATEALLGKAESPPDKLTADEGFLVEPEIVIDTVARTPLTIGFAFTLPQATHFLLPTALLQEIDLLATVATVPGVTVTDEKSVVE